MITQVTVGNYRFGYLRLYNDRDKVYYSLTDVLDYLKLRNAIGVELLFKSPIFRNEDGTFKIIHLGAYPDEDDVIDLVGLIELIKVSPNHPEVKKDYLNWIQTNALPALAKANAKRLEGQRVI